MRSSESLGPRAKGSDQPRGRAKGSGKVLLTYGDSRPGQAKGSGKVLLTYGTSGVAVGMRLAAPPPHAAGRHRDLPVLALGVSTHAKVFAPAGARCGQAIWPDRVLPSAGLNRVGPPKGFSGLNSSACVCPCQRFTVPSRVPPHHSGSPWVASLRRKALSSSTPSRFIPAHSDQPLSLFTIAGPRPGYQSQAPAGARRSGGRKAPRSRPGAPQAPASAPAKPRRTSAGEAGGGEAARKRSFPKSATGGEAAQQAI